MTRTNEPIDAPRMVDEMLREAIRRRASDIHVEPEADDYVLRYRVDGLLEDRRRLAPATGRGVVNRLMVMAQLLTYRLDVPQEGRIALPDTHDSADGGMSADATSGDTTCGGAGSGGSASGGGSARLAIMPTAQGLRAVIRLPADLYQPRTLDELELPATALAGLKRFAAADAGMLLVTGPAGSGKTTTIYALLDHIRATQPGLSIITLEDPVERHLPGITQIEVTPFGELTCERALKSILRQDPQVLMLGEIRDRSTASLAVQAALTGHRLVSTLHAGDPAAALARLLEMGIEPYQIVSAVFGVTSQRLLRRTEGGGYRGRAAAAEFAELDPELRKAVLDRSDAASIRGILTRRPGHERLIDAARRLVDAGLTDDAEVKRVLGE